jgi:hypothetical protein
VTPDRRIIRGHKKVSLCALFFVAALIVNARENPPPAANLPPKSIGNSSAAASNAPVRMVAPGILEIGKVRLDQRQRSVTLPAVLNMSEGAMEYFLVTTYGKTHESILKTTAAPYDIHLAMLLLDANGTGGTNFPGSPANGIPGPVINPSKETIPGNKVTIDVKWKTATGETQRPAEELVYRDDTQTVMQHGAWVYNGSLIIRGKFLAQVDGSIISLVTDPVALINNTGPGHDNDQIWMPNATNLPPANVPVELTITLKDSKSN